MMDFVKTGFRTVWSEVRRFEREEEGTALVIVTIMFVVILGFASLATDTGVAYWNRQALQNGVDAGALAGAGVLLTSGDAAVSAAQASAMANGISSGELSAISANPRVTTILNPNDAVVVSAQRLDNSGLRFVAGGKSFNIAASATAIISALQPSGIWPVAVQQNANCSSGCTIKEGAGGSYTGNFGFIQLGGQGGSVVLNNITQNYSGTVPSPSSYNGTTPVWSWTISTETGNVESATYNGFNQLLAWDAAKECDGGTESCAAIYRADASNQYNDQTSDETACTTDTRCPRVGIVPVIAQNWSSLSGNSPVTIVGFQCYYLQDFNTSGGKGKYSATMTYLGNCYSQAGGGAVALYGAPLGSTGSIGVFLWR